MYKLLKFDNNIKAPIKGALICDCVCKPGFVVNSHLSWQTVTESARCHLLRTRRASVQCPTTVLLQIGFTRQSSLLPSGELLPHLSTLTRQACGISLLHFPWGRPRRALPGALPCGARTFLTPFGARPPGSLTNGWYYTINAVPCQFFC